VVRLPLPEATAPLPSRSEVFLSYLEYFRSVIVDKLEGLNDVELRTSRVPSGWSPLALVKHLTFVERRWLVWGFEGQSVPETWGDTRDGRWFVEEGESGPELVRALRTQAEVTRHVVEGHALDEVGRPGERWDGAPPPTLERVLFHLLQEYARHAGHLDVARELIDGRVGE
jgi:hypothetical protein